ncbi:hypothetical protein, partial [Vibrio azureus]|uniref:hypothetical protein n=1 Tax=Vibrio azureus TaxID=512649 RepID=UPI0005876200
RFSNGNLYVTDEKNASTNIVSSFFHRNQAEQNIKQAIINEYFLSDKEASLLLKNIKAQKSTGITVGDVINVSTSPYTTNPNMIAKMGNMEKVTFSNNEPVPKALDDVLSMISINSQRTKQQILTFVENHKFDIPQYLYRADPGGEKVLQDGLKPRNDGFVTASKEEKMIAAIKHSGSTTGLGDTISFTADRSIAFKYHGQGGKELFRLDTSEFDDSEFDEGSFITTPELILKVGPQLVEDGKMDKRVLHTLLNRFYTTDAYTEMEVFFIGKGNLIPVKDL